MTDIMPEYKNSVGRNTKKSKQLIENEQLQLTHNRHAIAHDHTYQKVRESQLCAKNKAKDMKSKLQS